MSHFSAVESTIAISVHKVDEYRKEFVGHAIYAFNQHLFSNAQLFFNILWRNFAVLVRVHVIHDQIFNCMLKRVIWVLNVLQVNCPDRHDGAHSNGCLHFNLILI